MAEKSLFFNAFEDSESVTGYDRNYNADDISDWLSVVFETGVIKTDIDNGTPQGLKVADAGGLNVNVLTGKAAIKGKAYINTSIKQLTAETGGSSARYDMVVLRLNNTQSTAITSRKITVEYKKGTGSVPTVANLQRDNNVYELMLAYLYIGANSSTIGGIYDKRGDSELCPWFTAVKGYEDYYDAIIQTHESVITLTSAGTTVITDLPSNLYNNKYSLIEVYTNGIKEPTSAYNVSLSGGYVVITFTTQKSAGAKITVNLDIFLDGEGMSTALAQYTQLLQDVANLNAAGEYNYICNGINDNVLISNIIKAFYSVNDYNSIKLNIIGNIGFTAAAGGGGTTSNPYAWFDFTKQTETNRVATVDFSNASAITLQIAGGYNSVIFRAEEIKIIGANVIANNTAVGTTVKVFSSSTGRIYAENCRFWITSYISSVIAHTGTFVNCRGSITNATNNSYCFSTASAGLLRIYNGEYLAYTGDVNMVSAVVGQSGADAVSILYGVNAPTSARSGYYQTNSIYQYTGGGVLCCTDLISALPLSVISGISNIRGTIAKSKPTLM